MFGQVTVEAHGVGVLASDLCTESSSSCDDAD